GPAVAASAGSPGGDALRVPLVYQHEPVGELVVAGRAPGESFGRSDRRLLVDLARQAGGAGPAPGPAGGRRRARGARGAARGAGGRSAGGCAATGTTASGRRGPG